MSCSRCGSPVVSSGLCPACQRASEPAPAQRPPNGPKDGAPSFLFLLDVSVWPVIPPEGLWRHVPDYFRKRGERQPARADGFNFSIGTVLNSCDERTGTLGLSVWLCTNELPGIHPNGKRVWWQPLDNRLEPGNEYNDLQYEALFDADARTDDDRAVLIAVEESNADGYWHVVGGWSFPPEDIPWLSSLPATQAAEPNTSRCGNSTFQRPKSNWLDT